MKVIAYTQGVNAPSGRFRIAQHVSSMEFKNSDLHVDLCPARHSAYPPSSMILRPTWLIKTLLERVSVAHSSARYDLAFLQREMVSTLYLPERFLKIPLVFDVDDAIWLHQRWDSTEKICRKAIGIIAGNGFIADRLSNYNSSVVIIPTAVDTDYFRPMGCEKQRLVVWSGSSSGYKYLEMITSELGLFFAKFPDWKLRIVADRPPTSTALNRLPIDFVKWSPYTEVKSLDESAIGIMPLLNGDWEKGKCSFKMLTYMSTGLPVVVSAVGMNNEVFSFSEEMGFLCKNIDQWVDALSNVAQLFDDKDMAYYDMGKVGRDVAQEQFSRAVISAKIAEALLSY